MFTIKQNTRVDLAGSIPLFRRCSRKELATLTSLMTPVSIGAGRVLCQQGTVGHEAFIIVEGEATVTLDGHPIATLGRGDFFGELALLGNCERVATVTADTPMDMLVMTTKEFRTAILDHPTLAFGLLAGLASRLRDADHAIAALSPV